MGLFSNDTTTTTDYGPGVADLHNKIIGAAGTGMKPWFDNPTYQVAPMDPWQLMAGKGAAGLMGKGSGGSYAPQIAGLMGGVNMGDVYEFAGPLGDLLNERGMNQLGEQFGSMSNEIGQRAAASGAFGGSREAVQRGMLGESMLDATKDMAMGNDAAALQFGASMAGSNADRALNSLATAENARIGGLGLDADILGLLGAFGDQRQAHDQALLDAPYTGATRFAGFVPGISGTTKSEKNPSIVDVIGSLFGIL